MTRRRQIALVATFAALAAGCGEDDTAAPAARGRAVDESPAPSPTVAISRRVQCRRAIHAIGLGNRIFDVLPRGVPEHPGATTRRMRSLFVKWGRAIRAQAPAGTDPALREGLLALAGAVETSAAQIDSFIDLWRANELFSTPQILAADRKIRRACREVSALR